MNLMNGAKILKYSLLLGGIPPLLSGAIAMFFPDIYLNFIGPKVMDLLEGPAYGLVFVIGSLQGGDALVAGISRIIVAYSNAPKIMAGFAVVGIFHSLFELWLLPVKLLPWCDEYKYCSQGFQSEVWGFLGLHLLLIVGFMIGAGKVFLIVSHAIMSKGLDGLKEHIDKVFTTNSFQDFDDEYVYQVKI